MLASEADVAKLQANGTHEYAVLAAYFTDAQQVDTNEQWKEFKAVGTRLSQEFPTGIIAGGDAAEKPHKATFPSLVVFSQWAEPQVFSGPWQEQAIEDFVRNESHPLAQDLNWEALNFYLGRTAPMLVFYYDDKKTTGPEVVKMLKPLAKKYKGKLSFLAANGTEFERQLELMGLNKSHAPTLVIDELDRQFQHPGKELADFTTLSMDTWLMKYFKGELEAMPMPEHGPDPAEADEVPGEPEDMDEATDDMTADMEERAGHDASEEELPMGDDMDMAEAEPPEVDEPKEL